MGQTRRIRKNTLIVEAFIMACRRIELTEDSVSLWRQTSPNIWDYEMVWLQALNGKAAEKAAAQNEILAKGLQWLDTRFEPGHTLQTWRLKQRSRRRYRGLHAPKKKNKRRKK